MNRKIENIMAVCCIILITALLFESWVIDTRNEIIDKKNTTIDSLEHELLRSDFEITAIITNPVRPETLYQICYTIPMWDTISVSSRTGEYFINSKPIYPKPNATR